MNYFNSFSKNSPEIVELFDDEEEEDNYRVVKNSDGEEVTIILSSATESDDDGVILIEKEEVKLSDTGKSPVQNTSTTSPVSVLESIPSNVKNNDEDSTSSVDVVVEKSNKESSVENKEILEEKSNDEDSQENLERKLKNNEDLEEKSNENVEDKSNDDDSTKSEHSNDATVIQDDKVGTLETISYESEEDYKKLCLNLDRVIRLIHRRRTSKLESCLIEKTKCMPDGYMEKLAKIRGAGFSNEKAVRCALELANYDVAMAVNILLEEQHSLQFKKRMESIMIMKDQAVRGVRARSARI